jgi:ATP-dependent RNA helicase DHX36
MSATLDAEKFSSYFGGAPALEIPGFTHPVREHYIDEIAESVARSALTSHALCSDVTHNSALTSHALCSDVT